VCLQRGLRLVFNYLHLRVRLALWQHRQLPLEYPPLSIVAIALPVASPGAYPFVFGAWMICFAALAYFLLRWKGAPLAGLALMGYLVAGAWATVLERFDIVPAAIVLGAYLALRERRYRTAYLLLAVGTLVKVFPAFLVPLVIIDQYRSTGPTAPMERVGAVAVGIGLYVAVVGGGFALAVLMDPSHALGAFRYALSRPLEVESGPATLLWLTCLFGQPVHGAFAYGAYNLIGGADGWLGALGGVALVAGWAYSAVRFWRGSIDAGRAWIATLCIVLLTGKVFSAQYLIWIAPLIALIEGLDLLWLLIALSTTLVFPILFDHVEVELGGALLVYPWFLLAAIALRNVLLVTATLRELGLIRWERFRTPRMFGAHQAVVTSAR